MWILEKNPSQIETWLENYCKEGGKKRKKKKKGTECDFNGTVKISAYKTKSLRSWEW